MLTEWDERYAGPGFAYGTEPSGFLVEVADRMRQALALSLGEGEGRNAAFLGTGGPRARELLVTLDELREELAGLELVIAREFDREVTEGHLHRGRSAVVQVLAYRSPECTPP